MNPNFFQRVREILKEIDEMQKKERKGVVHFASEGGGSVTFGVEFGPHCYKCGLNTVKIHDGSFGCPWCWLNGPSKLEGPTITTQPTKEEEREFDDPPIDPQPALQHAPSPSCPNCGSEVGCPEDTHGDLD